MNKIIKYRKIIIISIVILSILFGIFIFSKLSDNNIEFLINNATKLKLINYKTIFLHLLVLSISFILAFIGIGIIILLIYLFFEGIIIGFMFAYFLTLYKTKGILYSLLYLLGYKTLLVFLIIILILKYLKLFKLIIKHLKKEQINITKTVINILIIYIIIILNDLILLFLSPKILNFLHL